MTDIINFMILRKPILLLVSASLLLLTACINQSNARIESTVEILSMQQPTQLISFIQSKTPFLPLLPTITSTITPTLSFTSTSVPLSTSTRTPTLTIEPEPTALPEEYFISGIFGHPQTYSISCEASAAADWANFFGVEAYESTIQFSLPISDNPEKGFVGNVNDPWGQIPPYSYGVHAEPIAQALRDLYELPAQAEKGFTLDEIRNEIANDRPVLAWVIGNMVTGFPTEFTDSEGNTTIVAAYEHSVVITGYSKDRIRYLNNGNFYEIPIDLFLNSWDTLGNMVVFYRNSE
ncbi:MAG: C39 family peptidase [Anaerolineaceae bacterium]